ncbi:sugar phosphate isomerase/epimerase family protein [Cohnella silvisoli]|uniref:Sugar phosphate isomerase/epimerase n=1 Tax=Cohnella silvisoli TaxID=2873699 RepID=A0ABV1KTR0_9BACL|nr:sugar phosphate isomerase/epimerase [Cohnella silvisoli]MCD9022853.1 sugar phosphate isomerase/epimerase [Cohnella silvisoli]
MRHKFAAQLYTLRDELTKDFPGTLRRLKRMGWEAVQIDGLFGLRPNEISAVLKETGLRAAGMHVGLDRMNNELEAVLEEGRAFGTKDFFCHYLEDDMQHVDGYIQAKKELLATAAKVNPFGYRVGYHNHDFEFHTMVEDKIALDYLMTPVGNQFLYPEVDTYWVKYAGRDPLEYIQKFPGRIPILHLKDMTADGRKFYAEIGTGLIDFEPILQWGENNGVEWYAVEQDECAGSPFDSLDISLTNLVKMAEKLGL